MRTPLIGLLLLLSSSMVGPASPPAAASPMVGPASLPAGAIPSFASLLLERPPIRKGLDATHPRLFFDAAGLEALRDKARRHPDDWSAFLAASTALTTDPPAPPAQGRGVHYEVGFALPEAAFAYAVSRDTAHRKKAMQWIDAAMAYEPWGYEYSKPNQDIPAAFLLYGLSFAYDLLASDLERPDRVRIAAKIGAKASQLFDAYRPKENKRYSFSQNHTFINAAAVGFAGLVLRGERREADEWIAYSRAVFDRVVRSYSPDGYYYEGYHYFEFSVPWIVHFLDAMEFNTGEQWYERLRLDLAKYFVAHSLAAGPLVFDFGDMGRGAADRQAGKQDLLGAHNILYRLAERYRDPQAAAVAEWVRRDVRLPWREPLWTFVWRNPAAGSGQITDIPRFYHFRNADVVFYRTSWDADATAVAFKCGPPEGHHVTTLLSQIPEWRLSTGHAHPDAGSFILMANGRYLTGDAGYTGVKLTADHNSVLIDGRGQENDGRHETFRDVPYDRLNRIRIVSASAGPTGVEILTDAAAAYAPELGVDAWQRTFRFDGKHTIEIEDAVRTRSARRVSVLLQSDGPIVRAGASAFRLDVRGVGLEAQVEPHLDDVTIEPHWVVAQGKPGSVEQGAREQRGVSLKLTSPPQVETRMKMTLRIVFPR